MNIKKSEKEIIKKMIEELDLSFSDKLAIFIITFKWPKFRTKIFKEPKTQIISDKYFWSDIC